jgi:hypothetical protein
MSGISSKEGRLISRLREALRNVRNAFLALLLACPVLFPAICGAAPADDDMAIARNLAEMLGSARTVISNHQDLINDPNLGDKHLSGKIVVEQAAKIFEKTTGVDPRKVDPASREGRLLRAMMAAIAEAVDDNQATINAKGTGFKGFIPAVFARLVGEAFEVLAKGEAGIKVTARPELVRNRKARPDQWEADVIETKLLQPGWPAGQPYSATAEVNGRPAFRLMVPEYYAESCLACHGSPKGEVDITGYPKEGGKLNDLGAVISIVLYH